MDNVPYVCKNCGSKTFKTAKKPESLDDFEGATCADCGAPFTKEDIIAQTKKLADGLVREAFRKAGLK